jgi:hypothetical protein
MYVNNPLGVVFYEIPDWLAEVKDESGTDGNFSRSLREQGGFVFLRPVPALASCDGRA